MQKVLIQSPAKTATQSGYAKTGKWFIKFRDSDKKGFEPLMGWTSSSNTLRQIKLEFSSLDEAKKFADAKGWSYDIVEAKEKRISPKSYAENYSFKRVKPFTH